MDFANERYVKMFTRDTTTERLLCFEAQAVWPRLLRLLDRSGVLDLGGVTPLEALAAALPKWPVEIIERGLADLVHRGVIELAPDAIIWPKFLDAQETPASDAQRMREMRARRRDTKRNGHVTERIATVTSCSPILSYPSELSEKKEEDSVLRSTSSSPAQRNETALQPAPAPVQQGVFTLSNGNGSEPMTVEPFDPELAAFLSKTMHLKGLNEPRYGPWWKNLLEIYEPVAELYVEDELLKADGWLEQNSPRRPRSTRGLQQFVRNWFSRAEVSARRQAAGVQAAQRRFTHAPTPQRRPR